MKNLTEKQFEILNIVTRVSRGSWEVIDTDAAGDCAANGWVRLASGKNYQLTDSGKAALDAERDRRRAVNQNSSENEGERDYG